MEAFNLQQTDAFSISIMSLEFYKTLIITVGCHDAISFCSTKKFKQICLKRLLNPFRFDFLLATFNGVLIYFIEIRFKKKRSSVQCLAHFTFTVDKNRSGSMLEFYWAKSYLACFVAKFSHEQTWQKNLEKKNERNIFYWKFQFETDLNDKYSFHPQSGSHTLIDVLWAKFMW